jgi:hypothetical protein
MMTCLSDEVLDDYLDGRLAAAERAQVEMHLDRCRECQGRLADVRDMLDRLHRMPVPEPDMRLFHQAIASARAMDEERNAHRRRRWRNAGWALAAGVVLMIVLNAPLPNRGHVGDGVPGLTIALHEVREVSLAIDSPRHLDNAVFSVSLPEGIELAGYPGQREITWTGHLEAGSNLLVLPLKAEAGKGGAIVTSVSHVDHRSTFVLNTIVTSAEAISAPSSKASANVVM